MRLHGTRQLGAEGPEGQSEHLARVHVEADLSRCGLISYEPCSGSGSRFWDGSYNFRLTVKQIIELEEKCGTAFAVIHARLWNGVYTANDVVETIRLGLIGGGADPVKAMQLVERYGTPFKHSFPVARAVIGAVMWGFEKSPLGKDQAATTANPSATTPPNSSTQPDSWDTDPTTSDEFHFGNLRQRLMDSISLN